MCHVNMHSVSMCNVNDYILSLVCYLSPDGADETLWFDQQFTSQVVELYKYSEVIF